MKGEPLRLQLTGTGMLDAYLIDEASSASAVVICPGGGYQLISEREGRPVAEAFNREGYHAFVLHYSVLPLPLGFRPLHELSSAVMEARRQISIKEGIEVKLVKIAICGFSAGGHLAGSLGTMWHQEGLFPPHTSIPLHRPDALILCYPVISVKECTHTMSFNQLAGSDKAKQQRFSLEKKVTEHMPPTFLWHTLADELVSPQNSLLLLQALQRNSIPAELHMYRHGVHGLSLATTEVEQSEKGRWADAHVATWFSLAVGWLHNEIG